MPKMFTMEEVRKMIRECHLDTLAVADSYVMKESRIIRRETIEIFYKRILRALKESKDA